MPRDTTKYNFNGKNQLAKNRLVLEVIKKYVQDNKEVTYQELKEIFPDKLQGSIGVIKSEDDLFVWEKNKKESNKREKRFFIDEPINLVDNNKIYVCTEWGSGRKENINSFIKYIRDNLNYEITENNIQNKEQDIADNYNMPKQESKNMKTKNIMLYGAPGVGKTHNYKRFISMIENGNDEKTIFDTISKNETTDSFDNSTFETIKKDKRIEFVTFHQSYSYEDFIEGFRPQDNGNIKLEDGIFKKLCSDAEINFLKSSNNKAMLFIDAIGLLLKDKIENQENVKINLKRNNSYYNIYDYNDKTIYFEKQNGDKSHSLSMKTLEKMYYEESNTIINGGLAPYYNPLLEELLKLKKKENIQNEKQKNFYIVIDEINRGNISKIFGELITLIEEDKRDSYEVTLPYSKEKFKIPSNLYIIATMNSTDKSIATIDIALRRRFTFLKMKPNINLVPQIAKELFTKLNDHIEKTINEDYKLGHSYFINVENEDDLAFVKEYKIKPLLEEYFYGDETNYKEAIKILGLENEQHNNL